MKTIYMVNERYIDEHGKITDRLLPLGFSTRELAAEFMETRANEAAKVNTDYFALRGKAKVYRVRSVSLCTAYVATVPETIERIILSTMPIVVKEES